MSLGKLCGEKQTVASQFSSPDLLEKERKFTNLGIHQLHRGVSRREPTRTINTAVLENSFLGIFREIFSKSDDKTT